MSKRTNFLLGLALALGGTIVLGVDRFKAAADVNVSSISSVTIGTSVGLLFLLFAVIFIIRSKDEKKKKEQEQE